MNVNSYIYLVDAKQEVKCKSLKIKSMYTLKKYNLNHIEVKLIKAQTKYSAHKGNFYHP